MYAMRTEIIEKFMLMQGKARHESSLHPNNMLATNASVFDWKHCLAQAVVPVGYSAGWIPPASVV